MSYVNPSHLKDWHKLRTLIIPKECKSVGKTVSTIENWDDFSKRWIGCSYEKWKAHFDQRGSYLNIKPEKTSYEYTQFDVCGR